jgi:hypothetical protein
MRRSYLDMLAAFCLHPASHKERRACALAPWPLQGAVACRRRSRSGCWRVHQLRAASPLPLPGCVRRRGGARSTCCGCRRSRSRLQAGRVLQKGEDCRRRGDELGWVRGERGNVGMGGGRGKVWPRCLSPSGRCRCPAQP